MRNDWRIEDTTHANYPRSLGRRVLGQIDRLASGEYATKDEAAQAAWEATTLLAAVGYQESRWSVYSFSERVGPTVSEIRRLRLLGRHEESMEKIETLREMVGSRRAGELIKCEYRAYDTVTEWSGPPRLRADDALKDADRHNAGCRKQGGFGSAIVVTIRTYEEGLRHDHDKSVGPGEDADG